MVSSSYTVKLNPQILNTLLSFLQSSPNRCDLLLLPLFSQLHLGELPLQLSYLLFQLLNLFLYLGFLNLVAQHLTVELPHLACKLRLFILNRDKLSHASTQSHDIKTMQLQLSKYLQDIVHGAFGTVEQQLASGFKHAGEVYHVSYGQALSHALLDVLQRLEMWALR
ncbi:restriction endonuclease [Striga asiatica]|uniref:Restriction endonuclease n=1 Tax=Striga asiatica TaxID=4170 RepID=A0A5A7QH29_STRAF|nr:restriction endonuclease [Striga asiatica]